MHRQLQECSKVMVTVAEQKGGVNVRTSRAVVRSWSVDPYTASLGFLKTNVERSEKSDSRFGIVMSASPG
jgi:hypothetical protein